MTPRAKEIADAIWDDWDGDREPLMEFFQRRFGKDSAGDGFDGLTLAIGRQSGTDDLSALLDLADPMHNARGTIMEAVRDRRAQGYLPAMETIIARPWECLSCEAKATLMNGVLIPGGTSGWPCCAKCGQETIIPVEAKSNLTVVDGGKR